MAELTATVYIQDSGYFDSSGWANMGNYTAYTGVSALGTSYGVHTFDLSAYQYYKLSDVFKVSIEAEFIRDINGRVRAGLFQYVNASNLSTSIVKEHGYGWISDLALTPTISMFTSLESAGITDLSKVGVVYQYSPTDGPARIYIGSKSYNDMQSLTFYYTLVPPLAPSALTPNNISQNPKAPIRLSWSHNLPTVEGVTKDTVSSSIVRYRKNGGAWTQRTVSGSTNNYTIPANTFVLDDVVEWQVATVASHNGQGAWSAIASITMAPTPPSKSTLIYPVDVRIRGGETIGLEWLYNSPYDNKPSKFDIRWKIGEDEWQEAQNTGQTSYVIPAVEVSSMVQWKVRAYGELGDMGPWSDIATFYVIAKPELPIIVDVSDNPRPLITFYAQELIMWQIQILQSDKVIYDTKQQHYLNNNTHQVTKYLDNGEYVAQIKIWNEYGYESDWGEQAFMIDAEKPPQPTARIVANTDYYIRIHYQSDTAANYIYRHNGTDYEPIARVGQSGYYDDYAAVPGVYQKYFVRAVSDTNGFNDSMPMQGFINYEGATLASVNDLKDILHLQYNLDDSPPKDGTFDSEYNLLDFIGREYSVVEFGDKKARTLNFTFFVTFKEYQALECLKSSKTIICLRDAEFKKVYGVISSELRFNKPSVNLFNGFTVSFSFKQTHYKEAIEF